MFARTGPFYAYSGRTSVGGSQRPLRYIFFILITAKLLWRVYKGDHAGEDGDRPPLLVEAAMKGKLIFVVDDEAELAHVVASYLERNGLAVAMFSSPAQALAAAGSCAPDLLLTDFKMDEMDGLTLATKVRETHPGCKMLIMSALAYDAIGHPARTEFEFLQKPLRISHVLDKIRTALN